ncbi:hypothetical protein BGZ60DRAFT_522721 [Tricladium varicosporioides]|nr:hypothetical protein BGZ60DRAFT_522721 [Hymenoscyphus varicosporioides]
MEVALPEIQTHRLVIAIDYGTTFTGIAFDTPLGNVVNHIEVVNVWGNRMQNHDKVPSVVSYSECSYKENPEDCEQQWGEDLSPNAVAMIHTKLQLDVNDNDAELDLILQALDGMRDLTFQYIKDSGGKPIFPRRTPEEIVEYYLKKLFVHLRNTVDRFSPAFVKTTPVDIVVTIPAEWSYRAKNSTFRALTRAGFNQKSFPELQDVILISEPEAAAIHTARHLVEKHGVDFLEEDDCFVLCDAGGGTVDVVSYKVTQVLPKLEMEPVTYATGDKCGSVFINLAFKQWLRELIGPENYQKLDESPVVQKITAHDAEGPHMREVMAEFDSWKRKFKKGYRDIKIEFSEDSPLANLDIPGKVFGAEFTIKSETMEGFFEPRVDSILDLILGQVGQLEDKRHEVKKVFLVGGFAQSEYLQQSIRESLTLRGLELYAPETSWTAVVRGAVTFGVEKEKNTITTMSACPRSYGIAQHVAFSDVESHVNDQIEDPITGSALAKDQLLWLIKKGDLILSSRPKDVTGHVTVQFAESGPRTGSIQIYAYDKENKGDLPKRLMSCENDLTKLYNLEYDMTRIPVEEFGCQRVNGLLIYTADLKLFMKLAPRTLMVKLMMGDKEISRKSIPDPILVSIK